jgi:hypothetical protein
VLDGFAARDARACGVVVVVVLVAASPGQAAGASWGGFDGVVVWGGCVSQNWGGYVWMLGGLPSSSSSASLALTFFSTKECPREARLVQAPRRTQKGSVYLGHAPSVAGCIASNRYGALSRLRRM